jgi:hypothetical protein
MTSRLLQQFQASTASASELLRDSYEKHPLAVTTAVAAAAVGVGCYYYFGVGEEGRRRRCRLSGKTFYWSSFLKTFTNCTMESLLHSTGTVPTAQQPWKDLSACRITNETKDWLRQVILTKLQKLRSSSSSYSSIPTKKEALPRLVEAKVFGDPLKGGFMGLVYKISLEWEIEGGGGGGGGGGGWGEFLPRTVVVKANPSNFRSAFASAMLESRREVVFYEKFEELFEARIRKVSAASSTEESLWSSVRNLIPCVYFSGGDAKTGGFCILMEDLSPKTVLAGHLFGNQCWGAVLLPEELAHVSHVEVLETLYLQMAKVHALFWQDKSLVLSPDQQWLKEGKWMKGTDRSTWEYAIQQSSDKWKVIQQQTQLKKQKGGGVVNWDPKLVAVTEAAITKSNWEGFQKEWNILTAKNLPFFTLTHGDFHAGNMLWSKNPSLTNAAPFYLIDWPCAGCESRFLPLSSICLTLDFCLLLSLSSLQHSVLSLSWHSL